MIDIYLFLGNIINMKISRQPDENSWRSKMRIWLKSDKKPIYLIGLRWLFDLKLTQIISPQGKKVLFQAAAQAAAAFLQEKDSGSSKLETAPWLKKPAPAPSNEDPRKKMSYW